MPKLELDIPQEKRNHAILSEICLTYQDFIKFCTGIQKDKIKEIVVIWEEQIYAK